jgi:tRNA(fMet)-specific endonuclease VapC
MKLAGEQLILDTNILVYWMRGQAAGEWLRTEYDLSNRSPRPVVPVVVVAEIQAFARRNKWGAAKLDLLAKLLKSLPHADISAEVVIEAYVDLDCETHARGQTMGKNDVWIAAIARVLGAVVLTTDKDFDRFDQGMVKVERIDIPATGAAP